MQQHELEQSFLVLIEFLMVSKRRVIELGAECKLTGLQTMMLFLLQAPRPMSDFKKIFNCDASNVTGLVDGLEQKQLAARFEDPKDRRIKMVQLSDKGVDVRHSLVQRLTTNDAPLLASLSDAETETFLRLMKKITTADKQN